MKRRLVGSIVLSLAIAFSLLSGCTGGNNNGGNNSSNGDSVPSDTDVYKLSLSMHDPSSSIQTIVYQEWADRVKEASGGWIEITIYPGGTLASAQEVLDSVKTGAADIGWVYTSFCPGQFPPSRML